MGQTTYRCNVSEFESAQEFKLIKSPLIKVLNARAVLKHPIRDTSNPYLMALSSYMILI